MSIIIIIEIRFRIVPDYAAVRSRGDTISGGGSSLKPVCTGAWLRDLGTFEGRMMTQKIAFGISNADALCTNLYSRMPRSEPADAWTYLSKDEICCRLCSIGPVLCESDQVLICIRCKYALQPSGQTAPKHLWEKYLLPAKESVALNRFVRNLSLPDPVSLLVWSGLV